MDGRTDPLTQSGRRGVRGLTANNDHVSQMAALPVPHVYRCNQTKGYHRCFHLTCWHAQMSVFCIICVLVLVFLKWIYRFFLFCFAFFVMIWSQTQPCFNVWIWILLNFALFFTEEQLTSFWVFLFFSLSPVLNVHSWLMWNPCGSGQTGHVTHSQWVGLCGAAVISIFLYFQGSRSAINVSKHLQHRHEVLQGLSSYFIYW